MFFAVQIIESGISNLVPVRVELSGGKWISAPVELFANSSNVVKAEYYLEPRGFEFSVTYKSKVLDHDFGLEIDMLLQSDNSHLSIRTIGYNGYFMRQCDNNISSNLCDLIVLLVFEELDDKGIRAAIWKGRSEFYEHENFDMKLESDKGEVIKGRAVVDDEATKNDQVVTIDNVKKEEFEGVAVITGNGKEDIKNKINNYSINSVIAKNLDAAKLCHQNEALIIDSLHKGSGTEGNSCEFPYKVRHIIYEEFVAQGNNKENMCTDEGLMVVTTYMEENYTDVVIAPIKRWLGNGAPCAYYEIRIELSEKEIARCADIEKDSLINRSVGQRIIVNWGLGINKYNLGKSQMQCDLICEHITTVDRDGKVVDVSLLDEVECRDISDIEFDVLKEYLSEIDYSDQMLV